MSNAWAYRATTARAGLKDTLALLLEDRFLCRTAFARTTDGRAQLIPYVGRIRAGDDLHVYYSEAGGLRWIGSFVITDPRTVQRDHQALPPAIGLAREGSALAVRLQELGYGRDPHIGSFTGFCVALLDGTEPPGEPRFTGRNAIGTFAISKVAVAEAPTPAQLDTPELRVSSVVPALPLTASVFGIDWSGGKRAGDKIWVAQLDLQRRSITKVSRPWQSRSHPEVAGAVAAWLAHLEEGWIAVDAPFGLASSDQAQLLGSNRCSARDWADSAVQRYPDRRVFIEAVAGHGLIGKNRRRTDKLCGSPFAPTLLQLIHQTYAAFQLLSRLDRGRIRVLPWEHHRDCPVTLIETCPAVLLKTLGQSNRGYKLRPSSDAIRRELLNTILHKLDWRAEEQVSLVAQDDIEGDALDAILCALAALRAIPIDHSAVASIPGALEEGWIYR